MTVAVSIMTTELKENGLRLNQDLDSCLMSLYRSSTMTDKR